MTVQGAEGRGGDGAPDHDDSTAQAQTGTQSKRNLGMANEGSINPGV